MERNDGTADRAMFTVGHSNQSMERFIELLRKYQIEVIVDVRSHPFSKYSTQFDMDAIKPALESAGLKYLYFGKELGGMPREKNFSTALGMLTMENLLIRSYFKVV